MSYGHAAFDPALKTFFIVNKDFCAELYEDNFTKLTLNQLRGLFKLMFAQPEDNREAIERLDKLLPEQGIEAYGTWYDASLEYQHKYSGNPSAKRANQELATAVKRAKAKFDRIIKIYDIFSKMKSEVNL